MHSVTVPAGGRLQFGLRHWPSFLFHGVCSVRHSPPLHRSTLSLVSLPAYFKYRASYRVDFRQLLEQRHSEDVSLSVPIVHARVSALSVVTERVSPEA